jgi:hypothetical protein
MEDKESLEHSKTNVPRTTASSAMTGSQQGVSKSIESPWNLSTPMTSPVISKQLLPNGTVAGTSYVKPANIPSDVSLQHVSSVGIKVIKGVHDSHVTENGGNVAYFYIWRSML